MLHRFREATVLSFIILAWLAFEILLCSLLTLFLVQRQFDLTEEVFSLANCVVACCVFTLSLLPRAMLRRQTDCLSCMSSSDSQHLVSVTDLSLFVLALDYWSLREDDVRSINTATDDPFSAGFFARVSTIISVLLAL